MSQDNILIELVNSAIYGTELNNIEGESINYAALFFTAQSHKVTNLVYIGLKNNADKLQVNEKTLRVFEKAYKINLIHSANQDFVVEELSAAFNENKVKFILLKGSFLKQLYPQSFYRTMSDVDILYDDKNNADIDKLMKKLEFSKRNEKDKDKIYFKYSILLELHKALVDSSSRYSEYLSHVWERAVRKNQYEYAMTHEDFLIFHMIHMVNHFVTSGIGIRYFLDIKLFLDRFNDSLNWEYLTGEFEKLGLRKFFDKCAQLSNSWFGNQTAEPEDKLLAHYVLSGGAYGSKSNSVAVKKMESEDEEGSVSKKKIWLRTVFPKYEDMKKSYNWLKSPLLLPASWIKLNVERLLRWKVTKSNAEQMSALISSDQSEEIDKIRDLFEELELI